VNPLSPLVVFTLGNESDIKQAMLSGISDLTLIQLSAFIAAHAVRT
jgi:hypothetical protein